MTRPAGRFPVLLLWSLTATLFGAPTAPNPDAFAHPLANARLAPELRAAAERDHIPLTNENRLTDEPLPGDSELVWVGARRDGHNQQWLVQLTRSLPTAAEQSAHRGREVKKYLSWGPVVVFRSEVDALDLWVAGPVDVGTASDPQKTITPARVRRLRVLVPRDYLRLGLDDTERVDLHIRRRFAALRKEDPSFQLGHLYTLEKPIKPENVAYARPVAERIGFTPELERAWTGGFVALQAFYELTNDVDTLREIAEIAVRKPAPWKLAKLAFGTHFMTSFGGDNSRAVDPAPLGLLPVSAEAFEVPYSFSLGKDLIVSGWMIVTRPSPPLDVGAGILALIAFHPTDRGRAVELVALGTHRGPPGATKPAQ